MRTSARREVGGLGGALCAAWVTATTAAVAAPPGKPGPDALVDAARVMFRNGDLQRAVDTLRLCRKPGPHNCEKLFLAVVEYQFLAPRRDELSEAEAQAFVTYDAVISPGTPAPLTRPVREAVLGALERREAAARAAGDCTAAKSALQTLRAIDARYNGPAADAASCAAPDAGSRAASKTTR